jgi:antitoxin ParD1/3/4
MSRITISMPDHMNEWVESQISSGRYGTVGEYVRELVRKDQERRETAIADLRRLLQDGEDSGFEAYDFSDILQKAREDARLKGLLGD